MFRPIHIVWNQSILGNRDIKNSVLEKQCTAQNGAKSVALSMPMMKRLSAYLCSHYSNRLGSTTLNQGNCQLHCQRYLYWLRAHASVVATSTTSPPLWCRYCAVLYQYGSLWAPLFLSPALQERVILLLLLK